MDDILHLVVTVTFPQTPHNFALNISTLSTDLPYFSQTFGNMSNVKFQSLSLIGWIGEISAEVKHSGYCVQQV